MSNVINLFEKKPFYDLTDNEADLQLLLLDFWAAYYEEMKNGGVDAGIRVLLEYSERIMDIQEKYR